MIEVLQNLELAPFILSFKLAFISTLILLVISIPLAWYLSQSKSKVKPFIEAITALPLVLPPSVLGFYILVSLSTTSPLGAFFEEMFDIKLIFNFTGLVVASCIYSLPFMVQPLQGGFETLQKNILEASYVAGKGKIETILRVALPNMKPAVLTGIIITFAHTVGEFGVILMVGGIIPEETKVASVAIYEMVEIMDYTAAHIYSAIMVLMSFSVLVTVYIFNAKQAIKIGKFHT